MNDDEDNYYETVGLKPIRNQEFEIEKDLKEHVRELLLERAALLEQNERLIEIISKLVKK